MNQRKNNNTILVPTDFSDVANNALNHALKVADKYNNEITLLYVMEEVGFLGAIFGGTDKTDLIKEAIDGRLNKLIEEAKTAYPKIVINKLIESGKVYEVVTEIANNGPYDSIIMGTNGASGLKQIVGSNSSRVINYAQIPVIVVKEKTIGSGYKKIVVPIDLTRESRQKLTWAVHVAKKFDSTLHIIYENTTNQEFRSKIGAVVNQTQNILDEHNVSYIVRGLDDEKYPDSFAEDTLAYASEIDADLIIIMSQQERGFSEYLLGSYAQQIVNHSNIVPVMCISSNDAGVILQGVFSS